MSFKFSIVMREFLISIQHDLSLGETKNITCTKNREIIFLKSRVRNPECTVLYTIVQYYRPFLNLIQFPSYQHKLNGSCGKTLLWEVTCVHRFVTSCFEAATHMGVGEKKKQKKNESFYLIAYSNTSHS